MKSYDIVIFPILEVGHYYFICFNLKNPTITVVDNMCDKESLIGLSDDGDFFGKDTLMKNELFVKYLRWVNHPRWNDILTVVPDKVKIDWATKRNNQDCGVFVMKHMEMFMGTQDRHCDCGFPTDKKKLTRIIAVLRKKYAAKMVTSEANILREKVIREANDLDHERKK
ncbi:hypothetical protein L1987_49870 [Smallanthus sonchifolius]|uniref:Uncharacterized protein n=1 Tax=Smallanthus sonchifolius TaxID=185202 RepID=A0ACB9FV95_9ASTR|nr:hypothetical protein L1987_49870 [Smallanthus sonchifolius]